MWNLSEALLRIQIEENRINRILSWLNYKLNKALALLPIDFFNYVERDVKFQLMAKEYAGVRFLLEYKQDYEQQGLYWSQIHENVSKREKIIWYILGKGK